MTHGVPESFVSVSLIIPLLFSVYLNDLTYLSECTELCNFADDTIFYVCDRKRNKLEHDSLPSKHLLW